MATETRTWEAIPSGNGEYVIVDDTDYDPETICTVHVPGPHSPYTALENAKAIAQLPELVKWKLEAMPLLMQWDDIGDMVGGSLGSSKVENVRNELTRLRSVNAKFLAACEAMRHYMQGDYHALTGDECLELLTNAIAEAERIA